MFKGYIQAVKRDRNNFITLILSNLELARHFHKRVDLNITAKKILGHIYLRFYIRRRYNKLYLYTRVLDKGFGNRQQKKKFLQDMCQLVSGLTIETTQGHRRGLLIEASSINSIVTYLKYISLFAYPKDFYYVPKDLTLSIRNYEDASTIPIHISFRRNLKSKLTYEDIILFVNRLAAYDAERDRSHQNRDSTSTSRDCNTM